MCLKNAALCVWCNIVCLNNVALYAFIFLKHAANVFEKSTVVCLRKLQLCFWKCSITAWNNMALCAWKCSIFCLNNATLCAIIYLKNAALCVEKAQFCAWKIQHYAPGKCSIIFPLYLEKPLGSWLGAVMCLDDDTVFAWKMQLIWLKMYHCVPERFTIMCLKMQHCGSQKVLHYLPEKCSIMCSKNAAWWHCVCL